MGQMKILFVHEVNYLEKVIFEMHEFPEYLASRGHEVTFLSFPENPSLGGSGFRPQNLTRIRGRVLSTAELTLAEPFVFGGQWARRFLAVFTVIPLLFKLLRAGDYDAIVLYAVPTYGLQTLILGRLFRVPVIYRAIDASHLIRKTPFTTLIKLFEKIVIRKSDFVSANNPAMKEYCIANGADSKRIEVDLPPVDVKALTLSRDANAVDELRAELGIDLADPVILFIGTFFSFAGLEGVIRHFATINEAYPAVRIIMVGGGEQAAFLQSLTSDLGLAGRVIFPGFVDYHLLNKYLALATVAINPMLIGKVSDVALPNKVLQYMAARIATVSSKLKGLYLTFGDESGISWSHTPEETLEGALLLTSDKAQRETQVQLALDSLSERFSLETTVNEFEKCIAKLVGAKK
jgi:glycosyltransferase involved in cell wall biosynthesis